MKLRCKNTGSTVEVAKGATLLDIYHQLQQENKSHSEESSAGQVGGGVSLLPAKPVCARVNNRVCSLDYRIYSVKDIRFLDQTSPSGQRTYSRTAFFILAKAVNDLYPQAKLTMSNSLRGGYFCHIETPEKPVALSEIKRRMQELIAAGLKIKHHLIPTEEAIEKFTSLGMLSKVKLLKSTGRLYTTVHELDGYFDYYYGALLPDTSFVTLFDLETYDDGLLLRLPSTTNPEQLAQQQPQELLARTFKAHHSLQKLLGMNTVGDLTEAVEKGHATHLINVSEAIQEKQLVNIAEQIAANDELKIVLIAGPSSSGKTSTCKRLSIQLVACGKFPLQMSLDDYFVDREDSPRQPNGDYDFESLYALNLQLFNKHLQMLLNGEEIQLPRYNFITGKSETSEHRLQMRPENVLVIEGIHALNPQLTASIDNQHIFRLYASALTSILLDDHNYIPTTDNRLLRRIIRDAKTRGCDARETIRRWPSVRAGEDKWIFPYQENADAMLNTAMLFELAALKKQVEPLLDRVPENCEEYSEAYRLLKLLRYIPYVPEKNIPPTSLLREFLGGSSFEY